METDCDQPQRARTTGPASKPPSGGSACGGSQSLAIRVLTIAGWMVLAAALAAPVAEAKHIRPDLPWREQLVRILGTTLNQDQNPVGVVAELVVTFVQRDDRRGIEITFETEPGRFSYTSQAAVLLAIDRTARAAHLESDSWSVFVAVPSPGVTVYGESLSAMVGITVVALAKGDFIPSDRVITGTVTRDGHIGTVGGVPLKVEAAHEAHMHRVLVPEEQHVADGDWQTPFLMQVSAVGTVSEAYKALTGQPIQGGGAGASLEQ
ncbi:MAG: S16 family serine protease [Nitrospiraceae bacterium]